MTDPLENTPSDKAEAAFDRMRAEHRDVLERMTALEADAEAIGRSEAADEAAERRVHEVLAHLSRQFDTHMRAEDEVIYPALEDALPSAAPSLAPLRQEHLELRSMLEALEATLRREPGHARNEQIAVQGQDFVDLLRIHIRKEESVVFAVAERVLVPDELDRITTWLKKPKGASTHEG